VRSRSSTLGCAVAESAAGRPVRVVLASVPTERQRDGAAIDLMERPNRVDAVAHARQEPLGVRQKRPAGLREDDPAAIRSNSGAPSSRSSRSSRRLTAGCDRCRSDAARVKPAAAHDRDERLDLVDLHGHQHS
jgi:hypothetical protein